MKLLTVLLVLGAGGLTLQASPPASNLGTEDLRGPAAKIGGTVVNSANGMPVPTATLTLRSVASPWPSKSVVTSDVNGAFLFDPVEPGRYTLFAEKPGFLRESYGAQRAAGDGTPLTVSEGQVMEGLVLKLTPQGVISGKVTDESGEPMEKVSVAALRPGYWQGKRALLAAGAALSNDLGDFRIANLRPGSYYVIAHRGDMSSVGGLRVAHADAPSKATPETPEESYADTYYPGSLEPEGATSLQVLPGSEISGVDIQFRKTRVFRVRGQVVDGPTGQPVTEARVALTSSKTGNVVNMSTLGGPPVAGGKFEVTGVIPGTYGLVAQVTRGGQTLYARQPVYVGDRNATDIVIEIPDVLDVAGRVRVTAREAQNRLPQAFRMESVGILLFPADGFGLGSLPKTTPQANGSFVLRNVVPDKFRVHVSGMPPGWYVKWILMGGQECTDGIADLTRGGTIEIVLAMGAAEVTGSVVDADDSPASGVTVALVPEDARRQGRVDLFRIATSDQKGQFQLEDVIPGSYKIFAWQEVESGAVHDAQFRRLFEGQATSIRISEYARESVLLKAISVEDVDRALGNP